jgi:hypothetical protein
MPLNYSISTRNHQTKSLLYKTVSITNDGRHISYKTINKFYKHLLDEGWEKEKIYVKVVNPQRAFTIKSFDDEMFDTLDQYYVNKVKDPSKFTNHFESVVFGIYN